MLSDGNYDGAIDRAVEALRTKKDSKGKQDYVYLLEEAFAKAKDRDLRSLELMIKEANPVNAERTYNTYMQLNNRQEKIRPLLPLQLLKQGRTATFQFDNYTNQIISSKIALTRYLYENASALLKSNNKLDFRKAYDDSLKIKTGWGQLYDIEGNNGISGALAQGEIYKPTIDGTLVYLNTEDIEETINLAIENGAEILFPITSNGEFGWVAEFKDCEGNRIALHMSQKE